MKLDKAQILSVTNGYSEFEEKENGIIFHPPGGDFVGFYNATSFCSLTNFGCSTPTHSKSG
jgi:hypothetical protein